VRDVLFARAALQREERDDRIYNRRQEARLSDTRRRTIDIEIRPKQKIQTISQPPQVAISASIL
jgi:hypothetical protein